MGGCRQRALLGRAAGHGGVIAFGEKDVSWDCPERVSATKKESPVSSFSLKIL